MAGSEVLRLIEVLDVLRSPGGCPWDAEQTHASLAQYLIEETYEAVEAIDTDDRDALIEELGDVLLQVVFHARIAQERAELPWDIDDVARGISEKLIRRHPHVFGDVVIDSAASVDANWQAIKNAEKGRTSVTEGVPTGMPPVTQAHKLLSRAQYGDVAAEPLPPHVATAAQALIDACAGDEGEALLAVTVAAHAAGSDADARMREAVRRLRTRLSQPPSIPG